MVGLGAGRSRRNLRRVGTMYVELVCFFSLRFSQYVEKCEEFISYSSDSTVDSEEDIPIEFLNTLNMPGLPQHEIIMKKICQ